MTRYLVPVAVALAAPSLVVATPEIRQRMQEMLDGVGVKIEDITQTSAEDISEDRS